jgi:hypothetical protein
MATFDSIIDVFKLRGDCVETSTPEEYKEMRWIKKL